MIYLLQFRKFLLGFALNQWFAKWVVAPLLGAVRNSRVAVKQKWAVGGR